MSMNKKFDNAYINQYTDNAIKRGYEIYDEWIEKKHDSRKIVASAERTVKLFKNRKTMDAFIDALAYLFALDMRIKEKYNNILRCLFSYFSWRRETRALSFLKTALNIPLCDTDIRDLIAVEIEKVAEKLESGLDEDGDDETHGGKRNGKSEEEAVATEEKAQEQEPEEKAEEITDAEEASEEKTEEISEQAPSEEPIKNEASQQKTEEAISEEVEIVANDEKDQVKEENQNELKEESNVPDDKSEPSTDKKEEAKTYNDAVDSPPLYEGDTRNSSDKKTSFIDEVIIDNMVKGKEDFVRHNPVDDVKQGKETDRLPETVTRQNEESKGSDKDAYLYDKMLLSDKGGAQQTEKIETTQQTEKTEQIKTDQPKEQIQNNNKAEPKEQEFKSLSEILEADTNPFSENNMIKELNNTISKESVEAIYQAQAEAMREQLIIASEELGIDAPVEIIGQQKPIQTQLTSNVSNRK